MVPRWSRKLPNPNKKKPPPAAKRLVWSIAEAGGGPQDVVARRYRRYAEQIFVALQVALYDSHLRFLTVSVKAPTILAQAPAND